MVGGREEPIIRRPMRLSSARLRLRNDARLQASNDSNARLAIMPKILPKAVRSQSLKFNGFCGFRAV
jgi:hypothetical protein